MSAYHWQGRKSGHAFVIVCLGCPSRPARLVPRRLPRACRAAVQIIVERPIRTREDRSDGIGEASRADRQGASSDLNDQGARPDAPRRWGPVVSSRPFRKESTATRRAWSGPQITLRTRSGPIGPMIEPASGLMPASVSKGWTRHPRLGMSGLGSEADHVPYKSG